MTALPSPGTTASATGTRHMQYGNSSHLTTTTMQASLIVSPRSTSASLSGPSFNISPTIGNSKRKRRPAGTPDPDAEVVALSPKTLMESDRYVCEICSQGFQRDQNLQMHRRKHKVPWKLLKRSSPEVRKRVYVCPDSSCLHHDPCHALGDLVGIKKHYRRKHSCDKQWKCEKCSKGYAVQSDYKAHLKTCGTRGHCCDCGRVFSRVESFIEHQDDCSAAREKTAIASSDQTSLASLSAREGSASPSADTVSVNNRSVGGVRSLDSTTKYESTTWRMDHRELQLLPTKQYMEFSLSSGPGCAVDHEGQDTFLVKEPAEAAFVSQSRLVTGSPILVNSSSIANVSDQDAAPPRLQLSIGLYYEASHETPCIERKEGLSKSDTAPERSNLTPPSLTSYASVTGSQRSSTTTNNEAVNRRLNFLHPHPTRNETSDLKVQVAREVEGPVHLELGTSPSDVRGSIENNMLVAQAHGQEYHVIEDPGTSQLKWTSPMKLTRFEAAAVRSEAAAPQTPYFNEMRSDSWKEFSRSQAEVSTSGSAAATTSRMRDEAPRSKHAEDDHHSGRGAWTEMSRIRAEVARGEQGREEELRRQAKEQLRLACVEKAYADEARESAKTQMEVAQADLRNATRIREHAQAQLLQAYVMQQQATRRVDASRLQITCQACRQKFHTAEVEAPEFLSVTPFQLTLDTSMDAP